MVELKKLENIPVYILNPRNCSILSAEDGHFEINAVSKEELKQEAINHIKVLRRNDEMFCCSCDDDYGCPNEDNTGTQEWIMNFFDITEEDLR